MKKSKKPMTLVTTGFALLLVIALVAFAFVQTGFYSQPKSQSEVSEQKIQNSSKDDVSYPGQNGKSALDLLKTGYDVEAQDAEFGEYVVSINGKKATTEKFWAFYVNDELAQVGAGDYNTKDGEVIEWRLE